MSHHCHQTDSGVTGAQVVDITIAFDALQLQCQIDRSSTLQVETRLTCALPRDWAAGGAGAASRTAGPARSAAERDVQTGKHAARAAFATYELDAASGLRRGQVVLADVTQGEGPGDWALAEDVKVQEGGEDGAWNVRVDAVGETTGAGVFDVKWAAPWLAAANSDGTVTLFPGAGEGIGEAGARDPLERKVVVPLTSAEQDASFCLSLDWNNRRSGHIEGAKLAVSQANGRLGIVDVHEGEVLQAWDAHAYPDGSPAETWITAFDCWDAQVLVSGADDAKLKVWDLRIGTAAPLQTNRVHEAGVCSVQFSTLKQHVFATGSYDQQVRVWDRRKLKEPTLPALNLQGGVWRVKWHPGQPDLLLTAAMRSGFVVLDTSGAEISPVSYYRDVGSQEDALGPGSWEALGYGADWLLVPPPPSSDGTSPAPMPLLATASFYDRTLRLLTSSLQPFADHTS
ncbi:Diphthine methyltransferase (Diphthamide biosynthesis protein 7) (DPH7) (WD repeat-containing protein 85) [Durusdinium trenchii]|uniref:methylated diphthine methylhydrolase n=1 Tax=Durusdinium trenchii TaxID=1381693 RepID=A0ABP0IZR2_9DINO